jgi:protocatechuate 3,4-dioxygenase beta subunit
MERRKLLKIFGGIAAGSIGSKAIAETCGITPEQTEGPFFPENTEIENDWDLTRVAGHSQEALGERILVTGIVRDGACEPLANSVVEMWQAAASGRYNHSGDTSGLPLDRNFQYYGKAVTDSEGRYFFKTIIPGDYPATPSWQRPPHLHFKVQKRGYFELTTQMYFKGHPLNEGDAILNAIDPGLRPTVVIEEELPPAGAEDPTPIYRFDLSLEAPKTN